MTCDEARPDLGSWLAGAVDAGRAADLEAHVEACAACGAELAGLAAIADALASARPASGGRRGAALLVAAGLALGVVLGGWGAARALRPPAARVTWGALASASGRHGPREAAPLGAEVTAPAGSLLALADGSLVRCRAGARLVIAGPRALSLAAGVAELHVARADEPFVVDTPRGRVRVLGTSFSVSVIEEVRVMESSDRGAFLRGAAAGAGVMVVVGVAAGLVLFEPPGGPPVQVEAGQQVVVGSSGPPRLEPLEGAAPATEPAEAAATVAALRSELEGAREARAKAEARAEGLAAELARAREAAPRGAPAEPARPEGPRVRFGRWEETALDGVDWEESAAAARAMVDQLPELVKVIERGEQPGGELMIEIARHNQKLVTLALESMGKLPTHVPTGNGSYTHPYLLLNVMAGHLEAAGLPLDEGQVRALERVGQGYDQAWEQKQAGYGAATLMLEKVTDELSLKRDARIAIDVVLSPAQREALARPETHDRAQVDIYSPGLILSGLAAPLDAPDEAGLAPKLAEFARKWGGLALTPDDPLVRRWAAEAVAGRAPVPEGAHSFFTVDAALQSARAQLAVMRELLARPDTAQPVREAITSGMALAVPVVVVPR